MHQHFYRWHRFLGGFAALIIIVLAISGIALNHTVQLRLAERHVQTAWVLDWYGIKPAASGIYLDLGASGWLGQVGEQVYFNAQLRFAAAHLHGALSLPDMLLVWLDDGLVLLQHDGALIEKLSAGLPLPIHRLGLDAEQRVIIDSGDMLYRADADLVQWQRLSAATAVTWSTRQAWPPHLRAALEDLSRQGIVTWERVLLDIHSARIFGALGVYVLDVFALLLAIMAISGLAMWLRRWRR